MNRYRYIRAERGMTLRELADRSGVSESTLMRIEAGKEPSGAIAGKLAKAYNMSLADLLGVEKPDKLPEPMPEPVEATS